MTNSTHTVEETVAHVICRSGKFECGQGTCAPLCMDQLGSPRTSLNGCHHAARIHADLASKIVAALASHSTPAGEDDARPSAVLHQRRGWLAVTVDWAINEYDGWFLDDHYDSRAILDKIVTRLR
ncbi:MAG TPA: hypothetical protein VIG66_09925, partial [Noviherbaspirillum sp.]